MAEEKTFYECESPIETKDRGLFNFTGKKEEEKKKPAREDREEEEEKKRTYEDQEQEEEKKPAQGYQDETMVSDFEKLHVSDPKPKVDENGDAEKKTGLSDKLHRSGSSSSSSSEEEEQREGEEKKKKKKKKKEKKSGEDDQKVDGEKINGEEDKGEKKGFLETIKDMLPGHHKKAAEEDLPAPAPPPLVAECVEAESQGGGTEVGEASPKKGFLQKMKEKLPGQKPAAEEDLAVPAPPPPVSDCVNVLPQGDDEEDEAAQKKGFLEKIKEKLPGHHPKSTTHRSEDENKNDAVAAH